MKMNSFEAIPPAEFWANIQAGNVPIFGEYPEADTAHKILMNGTVYFNEKLFQVFCPTNSFADKVQLAKKMFEHFVSEFDELQKEDMAINPGNYFFELADTAFCAFGIALMLSLHFKQNDSDKSMQIYLRGNTGKWNISGYLTTLTAEQYAHYKDIVDLQISLPATHAHACAQSNATKFFKTSDKEAMENNPAQFAQDNNLELHVKNHVCFFTERLPAHLIKTNTPRKVKKFEKFGFIEKEPILQSLNNAF